MIQPQARPFFPRQEAGRTLPSLGLNQQDRHRLEGLADAAVCLQEPGVYSTASSPSSPDFQEYTFGNRTPGSKEPNSYGIPSIQSLFAIADGDQPRSYGFDPPASQRSFRRPSTGSEVSFQGSFASVPELSRMSTASPPPTLVPRTPEAQHSIGPGDSLQVKITLGELQDQLKAIEATNKRMLQPARGRRSPSRQAPYSAATDIGRHANNSNNNQGARAGAQLKSKKKKPHFNLRYPRSVKLFILYYKEDCGWGWKPINKRRVDLLPVLYRGGYKPEIEENREVAGINGFYYRLNEVMPALTPDGSGLRFVERDGRSWELTVPQKCRRGGRADRDADEGARKGARTRDNKEDTEARHRGMVYRYPEEVVYYWDEFVKHFVPQAKQAELYSQAKRFCEVRAEQRRERGVPQWSPENEDDRVWHTNPPNSKSKTPRARDRETDEVLPELMRACELGTAMETG